MYPHGNKSKNNNKPQNSNIIIIKKIPVKKEAQIILPNPNQHIISAIKDKNDSIVVQRVQNVVKTAECSGSVAALPMQSRPITIVKTINANNLCDSKITLPSGLNVQINSTLLVSTQNQTVQTDIINGSTRSIPINAATLVSPISSSQSSSSSLSSLSPTLSSFKGVSQLMTESEMTDSTLEESENTTSDDKVLM